MKIDSITVSGFQCFGDPTTVKLSSSLTALIGANGTGKTAFLEALLRLFGSREQRNVRNTDFYVPPGGTLQNEGTKYLTIEARLVFPELAQSGASAVAVAPCFRHMLIQEPGGQPFCRVRLDAAWTDDGTLEGSIEQKTCWITTIEEMPKPEDLRHMEASERALIQVHYIPAVRGASSQLTHAIELLLGRLLRAALWSKTTQDNVKKASEDLGEDIRNENAVKAITATLSRRWKEVRDSSLGANPEIRFIEGRFQEIIRHFNVILRPNELNTEQDIDSLSEGQKSLFYFALATTVFDVEQDILRSAVVKTAPQIVQANSSTRQEHFGENNGSQSPATLRAQSGFDRSKLQIPALTVFAVEEPENHLSPHFLTRIIGQVRSLTDTQMAQGVLTSHSPAILGRVDPLEVRHFRLIANSRKTMVHQIRLPGAMDAAAKYVREAVIAFPELYFAKFVILGEGASEEIVMPRLAAAHKLNIDRSFVAITPLGGRHVNHFWKLLNDLDIPHATLLDLDMGRDGAGWSRVKYACEQLLENGMNLAELLALVSEPENKYGNQDAFLTEVAGWDLTDQVKLNKWLTALEKVGIFFSYPLDLDFAMLSRFTNAYETTITGDGPRFPSDSASHTKYIENAALAVVGDCGSASSLYTPQQQDLFPWYRYLFLMKGKPATHLVALSAVSDQDLAQNAPPELIRLVTFVVSQISQ